MSLKCMGDGLKLFAQSMRQGVEAARGACILSRMNQPIVTIFGSASEAVPKKYMDQAYRLSERLVQNKISVLTGGGPGIMAAANRGAASVKDVDPKKLWSVGVGVTGVDVDYENGCEAFFHVRSFYVRKWLLTRFSSGFVIFPGGIGTIDELFDVLNDYKHDHLPRSPFILVGSEYWQDLIKWYEKAGIGQGFINSDYRSFLTLTDDMDEAFQILNGSIHTR